MSDIIRVSDQFKAALEAREATAFGQMADAYVQIERRLLVDYELLLSEIAEKGISPSRAVNLKRYKDMMRQLFQEQEQYAQFVTQIISNEQSAAIDFALQETYATTEAAAMSRTPELAAELMTKWNQVPFDALEAMVGFAGDGSPLMPAMVQRFGSVAPTVNQTLKQGLALGWHPTKTVQKLRGVLDSGLLGNALTWARTETIRASREASRRSYEANPHIVTGWTRHATLDERTCAACIALDGKLYQMVDGSCPSMDDHPNGRCSMLPETVSYSDILGIDVPEDAVGPYDVGEIPTGRQFIESLPEARQRAYFDRELGKGGYDAWKSGKFGWDDIPKLNESGAWGNSWTVKSGKDLWGKGAATPARLVVPKFATTDEAVEWIKQNYADNVDLPDASTSKLQDIAHGMDDTFNETGVRINRIAYQDDRPGAIATYFPDAKEIRLTKSYFADPEKYREASVKQFRKNKAYEIEAAQSGRLRAAAQGQSTYMADVKLEEMRATSRFTVSDDTPYSHLRGTLQHESAHAVYYQTPDMAAKWQRSVARVNRVDKLYVSEYALATPSELYAEVSELIRGGRRDQVPQSILSIWDELMGGS